MLEPEGGSHLPNDQSASNGASLHERTFSDAAEARAALLASLERQRADQRLLSEVAELLRELVEEVAHWQATAMEADKKSHSLETELARVQERLRKSDDLLYATAETATPSVTTPSVATSSAATTSSAAAPSTDLWVAEHRSGGSPIASGPYGPDRDRTAQAPDADDSSLSLDEVHISQRHFNDSPFVEKMGSVRRSLGRPAVSLLKVAGDARKTLLTVAWEIVWYQYLLDLDEGCPEEDRALLFSEGMELVELADRFKQPNAELDDHGRLDASELEVSLLHNETDLLTHFSPEQDAALDDATEEIWDRHTMPEFRWDD
jgi:hypothetical protein